MALTLRRLLPSPVVDRRGLGKVATKTKDKGFGLWLVLLGFNYAIKSVGFTLALW